MLSFMPVSPGNNNNLDWGLCCAQDRGPAVVPDMLYTLSYPDKEIRRGSGVTGSNASIIENSVKLWSTNM